MNLDGQRDDARRRERGRSRPLLARPPRGARRHEPEGGLPAGRLRRLHRARRRRAAALLPDAASRAVDGAEVTTVEGLGTPEQLAPSRPAFHDHYASQCGFCTSGMMLAAQALIERGGTDDREEIEEALAGHVCRCTGYVKIIDAVAAVARGDVVRPDGDRRRARR